MRSTTTALALLGITCAAALAPAAAQTAQSGSTSAPVARPADPTSSRPATSTSPSGTRGEVSAPVAGANSFTEAQARSRIEEAGYSGVRDLRKDDQGVWRGQAMRSGTSTEVALDYQGHVLAGAAARGATSNGNVATGSTTATTAPRDGTPGNPPSTATGRAADRMQGQPSRPDGTPGNPPGTAAGRATDRALGTNNTGVNPAGSNASPGPGAPAR